MKHCFEGKDPDTTSMNTLNQASETAEENKRKETMKKYRDDTPNSFDSSGKVPEITGHNFTSAVSHALHFKKANQQ